MKHEDIKSPSAEELKEFQQKNQKSKLNIQSFKNLQSEIKRGGNINVFKGKSSKADEASLEGTNGSKLSLGNEENFYPQEENAFGYHYIDKNTQKPVSSIVIMENYIQDNKNLLKDSTKMRNNLKREYQENNQNNYDILSEKCQSESSSVCESNNQHQKQSLMKNGKKPQELSYTDLLEQTNTYSTPYANDLYPNNNKNNSGSLGNYINDEDLQQVDTLREYYMENEDQLDQLRRQETADFQFKNPDELDENELFNNPYLDNETRLAIEKIGTLSPTKIMQEIREINQDLNQNNNKIQSFYDNDLKTQVYMLKLQMKARMEDGLIQQRLELKKILNQYLQFIDKLMKDKTNLSETLQFSQTENIQLRDQLQEVMKRYDETENQLKQIFIAYKEQSETSKKEVELKEKKIAQMTEQLVLQEQGVKCIKQKCEVEYQGMLNQNKDILNQIMQLNSENELLQAENTEVQEKIKSLEIELINSKQNSQILASKNTELEQSDKQYKKFITLLSENIFKLKAQTDSILKQQDENMQQEEEFHENIQQTLNKSISSLSEEQFQTIKIQQSNIDKLNIIYSNDKNLILQNNKLITINQELEVTLKDKEDMFKQQLEQAGKQFSSQISNLQIDLTSSKQFASNLQESFEIHTKQSNIVQQLNQSLQKDVAELNEQISLLQSEQLQGKANIQIYLTYLKLQEKEQLVVQLEGLIVKFKDQISHNLMMIDEIFSGFKEKENLYNQEINEKAIEIKYLRDILIKQEDEVQKFYSQNEQIQLQQIDLLRSYFINNEQAKSSKHFIDHIQNNTYKYPENNTNYDLQSVKRSMVNPTLVETFIGQRDSRNHTPLKKLNQSQLDSIHSTQILGANEGCFSQNNKKYIISSQSENQESIYLRKTKSTERNDSSSFSIPEIESQRLYKIEQKNLIQTLEFEKTMKNALLQKDESIKQLSEVINNLKVLSENTSK